MGDLAAGYRALLELTNDLHACHSTRELEHAITERVGEVIPADLVTLNKIDLTGTMGGSIGLFVPERIAPEVIEPAFDRYLHQHPLVLDIQRTGDGAPRRMSDFIDMDDFRRLELYQQVFEPLGVLHQLGFAINQVPGIVIGVGINRAATDFSEDEVELATVLYRQLPAVYHHVQLREIYERELVMVSQPQLSEREREILVHLRAGQSNQQIADALRVGRRTVEKHLERLYAKLGVRTRTAAVHAVWSGAA